MRQALQAAADQMAIMEAVAELRGTAPLTEGMEMSHISGS